MRCVAELDEKYIPRMEDGLAVYEKPLSVREPGVCIDEKPVVLHEEVRPPVAMQPGRVARRDAEHRRCGTANVFCGVQPKAGPHFTKVTSNRSSPEFADSLLDIAVDCPEQPEFAYPQGPRRGPRHRGRRLAVESVHGALQSQTRQLVEPGGDCHRSILLAMPGPTPDWA